MVPLEDQRADVAACEQRAEVFPHQLGASRCVEAHAGVVRRLVVGLVLNRDRLNGYARRAVRLDVALEVLRERPVGLGTERSLDQAACGLHPPRRAPWRRHDGEMRIDRKGALHDRQHIGPIGIDREVRQGRVALARRHVVVAVRMQGEIRCAHGQADEAQADSGIAAEQVLQQRLTLPGRHPVLE